MYIEGNVEYGQLCCLICVYVYLCIRVYMFICGAHIYVQRAYAYMYKFMWRPEVSLECYYSSGVIHFGFRDRQSPWSGPCALKSG